MRDTMKEMRKSFFTLDPDPAWDWIKRMKRQTGMPIHRCSVRYDGEVYLAKVAFREKEVISKPQKTGKPGRPVGSGVKKEITYQKIEQLRVISRIKSTQMQKNASSQTSVGHVVSA